VLEALQQDHIPFFAPKKLELDNDDILLIEKIIHEWEEKYGVQLTRVNRAPYPFRGTTLVPPNWPWAILACFVKEY
jgi:hypothetical protein